MKSTRHLNLAFRPLTNQEYEEGCNSGEEYFFFYPKESSSINLNSFNKSIPNELKNEVDQQLIKQLNSFPLNRIESGLLMDSLKYESTYLWYYHRVRIYFNLRELMYFEKVIQEALTKENSIRIFTNDKRLIGLFPNEDRIEFKYDTLPSQKRSKISKTGAIKYAVSSLVRGIKSVSKSKIIKRKKHLIIVNDDHVDTTDIKVNQYYANLLRNGDPSKFGVLHLKRAPKPNQTNQLAAKKNLNSSYQSISNDFIVTLKGLTMFKKMKSIRVFLDSIETLKEEVQNSLSPTHSLFFNEFIHLRKSSMLYLFQYECYRAFFKNSNIKTISAISEQSPNERSIIDAAKSCNITTIGIQHGLISSLVVAYNFNPKERQFSPFPEHTIVWGKAYRDYLVESGCYSSDNLHVLGQLRTDLIPDLLTTKKSDLNLPKDPIILFASQPIPNEELRKKVASIVKETAQKLPQYHFIIKIHPAEKKEYYQSIFNDLLSKNVQILQKEIHLYELLAVSDIVTTCYSTVGKEAVYFNKPLITIDPLRQDIAEFVKDNIAENTTNSIELIKKIHQVLSDDQKFVGNYASFKEKNILSIDGQTTQRYLDFIYSFE